MFSLPTINRPVGLPPWLYETEDGGAQVSNRIVFAVIVVSSAAWAQPGNERGEPQKDSHSIRRQLSRGELSFIENRGQFDPAVKFQARRGGQLLWFTNTGVVFDMAREPQDSQLVSAAQSGSQGKFGLPSSRWPFQGSADPVTSPRLERLAFAEEFANGNRSPQVEASGVEPGIYNYFIGNDPAKWRTDVKRYSELVYHDVWPGIDVRFVAKGADIEQEFVVHHRADASRIRVAYCGTEGLQVAADGSLIVDTLFGQLRETAPVIFEQTPDTRVPVTGRFKLAEGAAYGFEVADFDRADTLVIDPTLLYSTYLGGTAPEDLNSQPQQGFGIAVDPAGNAYVSGFTNARDFPTTVGSFQTSPTFQQVSAFVSKLNPLGSALVYSTYLSGTSTSSAQAIAVDSAGEAYVTGIAGTGFPVTPSAFQTTPSPIFFTKLSANGDALLYSTFIGPGPNGEGPTANGIAIDSAGRAYITGGSEGPGFPTTANAFQSTYPGGGGAGFLSVFDPSATGPASLVYSTYFGVTVSDITSGVQGQAVAVDAFGMAYVTGYSGNGFPTTPGAFQTSDAAPVCQVFDQYCYNAIIAKFNPYASSGSASLIYATYLGDSGGGDIGLGIAVDSLGNAYVTGTGANNFPVTPGAFQTSPTNASGFVTKLNASGNGLIYSTYLQGTGTGIALDSANEATVAGFTSSRTLPVTPDAFQSTLFYGPGGLLTRLSADGSSLVYSSYLRGTTGAAGTSVVLAVAVDQAGDAYLTGTTQALDFPTTPFAYQPVITGTDDAFVTKFPLGAPGGISITGIQPNSGGNAGTVSPQIVGTGFHAGVTAQLNCGGQSIVGTNVVVSAGGQLLNTTFDLTTTAPGTCSLVVTNPDGTSATLLGGFTVQQGGATNLLLYLTGATERAAPVEVSFAPGTAVLFATISNGGTVDSAPTLVSVPLDSPFSPTSATPPPLLLGASSPVTWIVPSLPARSSATFTTTAASAALSAACSALWGPICLTQDLADVVSCIVRNGAFPACTFAAAACTAAGACIASSGLSLGAATTFCLFLVQTCVSSALNPYPTSCLPVALECIQNSSSSCASAVLPCVEPEDPNNLIGSPGVGGVRWVSGEQGLTYEITYGNDTTATAPAQQVVVAQPLGPDVGLSGLRLLPLTIPTGTSGVNVQVPVPPGVFNPAVGLNEFITTVDLRPTQSLLVNVDAKLNTNTQTLTWTLSSIDPTTGSPPLNPLVGFLPPGVGGNIAFTVNSAQGLASISTRNNRLTRLGCSTIL